MITLIEREFTVDVALQEAWDHLARIEQWPSWARHIKRIELQPPGELGARSRGVIHLTNGIQSAFRMTEFNPTRSWKWTGPILWLSIDYDHRFEAVDDQHTRLIWTVAAEGRGASSLGWLYALIYRRSMEQAIQRLIREMNGKAER